MYAPCEYPASERWHYKKCTKNKGKLQVKSLAWPSSSRERRCKEGHKVHITNLLHTVRHSSEQPSIESMTLLSMIGGFLLPVSVSLYNLRKISKVGWLASKLEPTIFLYEKIAKNQSSSRQLYRKKSISSSTNVMLRIHSMDPLTLLDWLSRVTLESDYKSNFNRVNQLELSYM